MFRMSLFVSTSLLQYTFPHIKTPLFVLNSPYDTWQLSNILQLNCTSSDNCPEAEKEAFYNYRNVSHLTQATPGLRYPEIVIYSDINFLLVICEPCTPSSLYCVVGPHPRTFKLDHQDTKLYTVFVHNYDYCIEGNFRGTKIFVDFSVGLTSMKIQSAN